MDGGWNGANHVTCHRDLGQLESYASSVVHNPGSDFDEFELQARQGSIGYPAPGNALRLYRKRWEIECLFADTGTRGFNIEDTHITDPAKLATLLAFTAQRVGRTKSAIGKIRTGRQGYST